LGGPPKKTTFFAARNEDDSRVARLFHLTLIYINNFLIVFGLHS